MTGLTPEDIAQLYSGFERPINQFDCGQKCAPYNEGIPFCCDTRRVVPTAYLAEWDYLRKHTDLWHPFTGNDPEDTTRLQTEAGPDLVVIECQGFTACQREFRSLTCRAFPFFPYLDSRGIFLGLSPYWNYEKHCWVISHLDTVEPEFLAGCIQTFETLFKLLPQEQVDYAHHSAETRRLFRERRRAIVLLHRDGKIYKVSPRSECLRQVSPGGLPKFGNYKIAACLPFPGER